ncbi:aminomethyltransferase, mitochondrial [Nephila pilipes]|uniref:aminomethyltransferase n=1 Tax=Nephila pilipes TaxID=299642 RepID=A0A8X6NZF4_NEPPI|nr:aminomethyltransferase, mitochondrial [Nephila pilipes]
MYSVSRMYKKAISVLGVSVRKSSGLFIGNAGSIALRRATPSNGGLAVAALYRPSEDCSFSTAANTCTRASQTDRSVMMTTSLMYLQRAATSCKYSTSSGLGITSNSGLIPNESLCPFLQKYRSYSDAPLKDLALHDFHAERGAKFGEFAGYRMPLYYSDLTITESHLHTRSQISVFDVSHMRQMFLKGKNCGKFLETLVVSDLQSLESDQGTLTLLTNENGGIIDDMIITKCYNDEWYIVSNAAYADKVVNIFQTKVNEWNKTNGDNVTFDAPPDKALLAFQGPKCAETLQIYVEGSLFNLPFMHSLEAYVIVNIHARINRAGYTGEDGFEMSMTSYEAKMLLEYILNNDSDIIKCAGLGARDTLRLEAGLCLSGTDFNESITPIEASLAWTIGERRRKEGGFPGADIILRQLQEKPKKKRVGFISSGGACPRSGEKIFDSDGKEIGYITSGCPSPCLKQNIGMGYIHSDYAKIGTPVEFRMHNKKVTGTVSKMPFVPHKYKQDNKPEKQKA